MTRVADQRKPVKRLSQDWEITALLCDAAQVAGGKLCVLGGGWSLGGRSYHEIAQRFDRHTKSVDNGLWRVKCKIKRLLARGALPMSVE